MTRHLQPYQPVQLVSTNFTLQRGVKSALLVTNVVDDSSSISSYGNTESIRRGYNQGLDQYRKDDDGSRQLIVSTLLLNRGWLYAGKSPTEAAHLDRSNYVPGGNTPLFIATEHALEFVSRASDFLTQQGLNVYSMTYILTDGADTSGLAPFSVKPIVSHMQQTGLHIVAGIAVRDGSTKFHQVFTQMGIREEWIKVVEREDGDIVEGMTNASATVMRTQTANPDDFRRTTTFGFHGTDSE